MAEFPVLNIIYSQKEQGFDFVIPAQADRFILGSERELIELLERLRNRLVYKEYPFAFLQTERYQVGDRLVAIRDCMNNFREGQVVEVTSVQGNYVVLDDVAYLFADDLSEEFRRATSEDLE